MKTDQIKEHLDATGAKYKATINRKLLISGKFLRGVMSNGTPFVAVGGENKFERQLHTIVDSVHWYINKYGETGKMKIIFGSNDKTDELLLSAATLLNCIQGSLNIDVEVNFQAKKLRLPNFDNIKTSWLSFFEGRDNNSPPELAHRLKETIDKDSFRWYRNVTGNYWSGRIEGIEVCKVFDDGQKGELNIGNPGKNGKISKAREVFLSEARDIAGEFSFENIDEVAKKIQKLATKRRSGELRKEQPEHFLEARVLRERIPIQLANGSILRPLIKDYPFQFPTLWTPSESARFLDVLMHDNDIPYAVELKVNRSSGGGEYYRHAITQAVLYREFIKTAKQLRPWFESQGLKAVACKGLVAFPKMIERQRRVIRQHRKIAGMFDIEIVEVSDT